MKRYLTFVLAEISAVGACFALTILFTQLIQLIGLKRFPSERAFTLAVLYDGLPAFFLCGLLGGLIVRGKPVVFGIVLVLITGLMQAIAKPTLVATSYFWIAMCLSFDFALAGAAVTTWLMSRLGKREPVHPGWAGLTGFIVIAATWTLTFFFVKSA